MIGRQMHKTIIFCLNFAGQLQTNNEQTHIIDPRVDKPVSETHGPSCSDYRVA